MSRPELTTPTVPLLAQARRAAQAFREKFQQAPRWLVAAPGRVNLIGEHTDYNAGFVMPMAIERYTVVAASPTDSPAASAAADGESGRWQIHSQNTNETCQFDYSELVVPHAPNWTAYVRGVLAGYLDHGFRPGSVNLLIDSTVPVGGGLSSSAALEVSIATLIEAIVGRPLDKLEKIKICRTAEHTYAQVPCGIMDQFTSVMGQEGHLLLIDCRHETARHIELPDGAPDVLIFDTNVKHQLSGGEYAKRRANCLEAAKLLAVPTLRDLEVAQLDCLQPRLPDMLWRRTRHIVTENERTLQAAELLTQGDWLSVGRLMNASHQSLRDDYEVSCGELNLAVELAQSFGPERGVFGARMTGGGFGGCTVNLVDADAVPEVVPYLQEQYSKRTGITPTMFLTRPAEGAHILQR